MAKTTLKTVLALFACVQAVVMLSCGGVMVQPVTGEVGLTSNPQVARYSVITKQDATVTIEFGPDTSYGRQTWSRPTPAGGGEVDILVAGMRSFSTYHMRADVEFADGTKFLDTDHVFVTGGPPAARVPKVTVTRPGSLQPNGGVELLDLVNGANNELQAEAVDLDGNLIWYYDFDGSGGRLPFPIKLLPNGDMLIVIGSPFPQPGVPNIVREIDLAGRTVWEFSLGDLNKSLADAGSSIVAEQIHHDFLLLPNGHMIIIVEFHKNFTNLTGFPGTTAVLGDALIDLDLNRKPVWVWSTFDHLDVNRHPLGLPDWTHGNALVYSPDDGDLLFSMRDQDWVIKIDYKDGSGSGDILWRLGPGGDFTLPGGEPIDWFYGQHAPAFVGPNTSGMFKMVLFDNGNGRVVDSSGTLCGASGALPCYSRVPILQLDETSKTAQVLWQDKLTGFSFFAGYAQELENGNVEFNVAEVTFAPGTADPGSADVIEVTQETTPQAVWELDVDGQNSYRIFRIPSLYPGVQW